MLVPEKGNCFNWEILLMVQKSGEKTTWDGAETKKYWEKLPTSTV